MKHNGPETNTTIDISFKIIFLTLVVLNYQFLTNYWNNLVLYSNKAQLPNTYIDIANDCINPKYYHK